MTRTKLSAKAAQALQSLEQRSEEQQGALRERAMLVRFATGRWYGRAADEEIVDEVRRKHAAQGDIGTFTKRFMSSDRMAPIELIVREARKYHKRHTLAWGDDGSRLLPADLYFDYKREMTAFEMRFEAAVAEFLARFPEFVEAERVRLNGLFRESDYPSIEELRARFHITLSITPLPSSKDFRVDLGESEVQQIRAQIDERVTEALQEATRDAWGRMHALVGKLKERLESSDAQVRAALFDNLRELVAMLPSLNVARDPALDQMTERVRKELLALDVAALRDDEGERREAARKTDDVLRAMDRFMSQKGK